jgi:diguanylate cyclase (GGDEF)-like protein
MLNMNPATLHKALERLEQAAHDHAAWQEHLLRVIFCGAPVDPDDLAATAHVRCHLGRWYYEQAPAELRDRSSFAAIGVEHERLHHIAAQLLRDVEVDSPVVRVDFEAMVASSAGLRLAVDAMRREIEGALRGRDALTGAFRRVEMLRDLREWHQCARQGGEPCCLALADLDHLTAINETHGYPAGDQALVGTVRFLVEHLRDRDKVFRYTGSEFLIAIPGADLAAGQAVIARLRESLTQRLMIMGADGAALRVTASFGIALLDPEVGVVDSIDRAEQALLLAKAAGGNRSISWDPSITTGPRLRRLTVVDPQE